MAQAQLELGRKETALAHAERAYELCSGLRPYNENGVVGVRKVEAYDDKLAKSMPLVVALITRCKKEVWQAKERARLREIAPLLEKLVTSLETERDADLADLKTQNLSGSDYQEYSADIHERHVREVQLLRKSFELSSGSEVKLRDPPDWILDDITLSVMRNPVLVSIAQTILSFQVLILSGTVWSIIRSRFS